MTKAEYNSATPIKAKLDELDVLIPALEAGTSTLLQLDPSYVQASQLQEEINDLFNDARAELIAGLNTVKTNLEAALNAI